MNGKYKFTRTDEVILGGPAKNHTPDPTLTTQHIKSLVADYIFKIYGEVPSDKLWDELWEKVNKEMED